MAGSRSLIFSLFVLSVLVAIASVSAEDSGSAITTPAAMSPVEDYEGSDTPVDSDTEGGAESPDAGSLGAPVSSVATDSSTEKTTSGASSAGMAGIAVAATGALVGYIAF